MKDSCLIAKLEELKRAWTEDRQGYRDRQYDALAVAMAFIIAARCSQAHIEALLSLTGGKADRARADSKVRWLTSAVVAYVTSAKSGSKLTWKRARVLDYLYDVHEVKPEMMPAEIYRRGGIEAIAKEAIKETPRRAKVEGSTKGAKSHALKETPPRDRSASASKAMKADKTSSPTSSPGVEFRVSRLLEAKLTGIKPGETVNIRGTLLSSANAGAIVVKLHKLRSL